MSVNATSNATAMAKLMVTTISLKSSPAIPGTNNTGTKTASVVSAEAVIARATCVEPSMAELILSAAFPKPEDVFQNDY